MIENVYRKELSQTTYAPTIRISKNANIKHLRIRNIHQEFVGDYIECIENKGNVEDMKVEEGI